MLRQPTQIAPQLGFLRAEQFQIAYATSDIEAACTLFREQFGISDFASLEGPLAHGGQIKVRLAWVGSVMYELMWAEGAGSAIYMDRLGDSSDFCIKHHHLGFLLDTQEQWDALMSRANEGNQRLAHLSENPDFITSCFIDAPALGHYLEYLFPAPAGRAFFENVPRT